VAYTCPVGKRASVQVTALIQTLTSIQNLRFRVATVLILQRGTGETITSASPVFVNIGLFHINAGDTVTTTTSNSGTEGGILILNASVLAEVPE